MRSPTLERPPGRAVGILRRAALRAALAPNLALPAVLPGTAWAGRRVIVAEGTAGPDAQAAAAVMVLLPVVAVLVFALARLIAPPRE